MRSPSAGRPGRRRSRGRWGRGGRQPDAGAASSHRSRRVYFEPRPQHPHLSKCSKLLRSQQRSAPAASCVPAPKRDDAHPQSVPLSSLTISRFRQRHGKRRPPSPTHWELPAPGASTQRGAGDAFLTGRRIHGLKVPFGGRLFSAEHQQILSVQRSRCNGISPPL